MTTTTSVINTDIANYNQAFYDKLLAMEAYTYNQSEQPKFDESDPEFEPNVKAGFDEYSPFWTSFSNEIVEYLNGSISREQITDFLLGLFVHAHATLVRQRGDQQLIDDSSFDLVFNINELVETVLEENIDYYDDYVAPTFDGEGIEITEASAPNLQADTDFTSLAFDIDKAKLAALVTQYTRNTAANAVRDIYEGVDPSTFGHDLTPTVAYELVFDTLNWSTAFDVLNIDLDKPQRPIS